MSSTRSRELDMGYTISEFVRVLQGNFSGVQSPYQAEKIAADRWQVVNPSDFSVIISLSQKPPRKLGLLELPVLAVSFVITSGDDSEEQAFYEKFFKYFHKGGG